MGAMSSVIIGLALVGSWDTPFKNILKDVQKVTSVSVRKVQKPSRSAAGEAHQVVAMAEPEAVAQAAPMPPDVVPVPAPAPSPAPVQEIPELPAPVVAAPPADAPAEVDIYAEQDASYDIYAPKVGKKKRRVKLERTAGDNDVILIPSARPLPEGDVNVSLDELLLWRVSMGVTDDLTLEASTMWGFSAGVEGKYALIRKNNTALSFAAGAAALTIDKQYNASHLSLLYAKDFAAGAIHAGGHLLFAHARDERGMLIPELTLGGEAKLMKRVTAIGEVGFGNDIVNATNGYDNNTGFANLGLRVAFKQIYATGSLFMPTNANFLNSRALGIPFLRVGGTF